MVKCDRQPNLTTKAWSNFELEVGKIFSRGRAFGPTKKFCDRPRGSQGVVPRVLPILTHAVRIMGLSRNEMLRGSEKSLEFDPTSNLTPKPFHTRFSRGIHPLHSTHTHCSSHYQRARRELWPTHYPPPTPKNVYRLLGSKQLAIYIRSCGVES
jgi:hypothetical protein